jgi:hypothetical protein
MTLPKFLSVRDVEAWLLQLGLYADRHDIARALRLVPLDGVIAPGRHGQRWTVPKERLLQLLVVCVARRAGRRDAFPVSFDRVYLDAAEHLMEDPELARTMPPSLKERVRERRKARRRNPWWFGGAGRAPAG